MAKLGLLFHFSVICPTKWKKMANQEMNSSFDRTTRRKICMGMVLILQKMMQFIGLLARHLCPKSALGFSHMECNMARA